MSPATPDPVEGFDEALSNLDFDRARKMAAQVDDPLKPELLARVRTSRAEAADRAEKLAARIQFLARADHYEALLALAADPMTSPLLDLLSTELQRGARLHLEGAVRRQKRFRAAGVRHMKAAADALVLLDISKAASELNKVETRWLTEAQRDELSELRHQVDQAAAERQELDDRTAAVLREQAPSGHRGSVQKRRGGCLGTVFGAIALLALVALASRRVRSSPRPRR